MGQTNKRLINQLMIMDKSPKRLRVDSSKTVDNLSPSALSKLHKFAHSLKNANANANANTNTNANRDKCPNQDPNNDYEFLDEVKDIEDGNGDDVNPNAEGVVAGGGGADGAISFDIGGGFGNGDISFDIGDVLGNGSGSGDISVDKNGGGSGSGDISLADADNCNGGFNVDLDHEEHLELALLDAPFEKNKGTQWSSCEMRAYLHALCSLIKNPMNKLKQQSKLHKKAGLLIGTDRGAAACKTKFGVMISTAKKDHPMHGAYSSVYELMGNKEHKNSSNNSEQAFKVLADIEKEAKNKKNERKKNKITVLEKLVNAANTAMKSLNNNNEMQSEMIKTMHIMQKSNIPNYNNYAMQIPNQFPTHYPMNPINQMNPNPNPNQFQTYYPNNCNTNQFPTQYANPNINFQIPQFPPLPPMPVQEPIDFSFLEIPELNSNNNNKKDGVSELKK